MLSKSVILIQDFRLVLKVKLSNPVVLKIGSPSDVKEADKSDGAEVLFLLFSS